MIAKNIGQSTVDLVERHLEGLKDVLVEENAQVFPRSADQPLAKPI